MMKIIRVFPRRTKLTPNDRYAFVGDPPMIRPEADEVHVSCTFTWDKEKAERLQKAWSQYYRVVKLGGPVYGCTGLGSDGIQLPFTSGKYIKSGVTFTSRGCENQCPWCLVPFREGKLSEQFNFPPGHLIQDNNFLQCSQYHIDKVFEMLRYQGRPVSFTGGLDSRLVNQQFVDELKTVPIDQIFLACDTDNAIKPLQKAVNLIGLPRDKVRCYVLLKFNPDETIAQATARLAEVWEAGAIPFAQLYQPPDKWINYSKEWTRFTRTWQRPAATKAFMRTK